MTKQAPSHLSVVSPVSAPDDIYRQVADIVSAEAQRASGQIPIPPKAAQEAYIDALAPRGRWFDCRVHVPVLGSIMFDWCDEEGVEVTLEQVRLPLASFAIWAAMPERDGGDYVHFPRWLMRIGHVPWLLIGVPLLIVSLLPSLLRRFILGYGYWRIRRPWMRLMWRLRPQEMARRLYAREAKERADVEELRLQRERWAAEDAAREAKREAAFEAEVERRLALRLAAAGA